MENVHATRLDWDGFLKPWTAEQYKKHSFRLPNWVDEDDLVSDGFIYFLTCCERYPSASAAHLGALYGVCIRNHINGLSNSRTAANETSISAVDGSEDVFALLAPVDSSLILAKHLDAAPQPIKKLVAALDRPRRARKCRRIGGVRETTNSYLCRLAGLDPSRVDLRSMLSEFVLDLQSF